MTLKRSPLQRKAPLKPKPPKQRACANPECDVKFTPARSGQKVCSPKCALAVAPVNAAKAKKAIDQVEREASRKARERVKPKGEYAKEAQAAVNAYVRLRDAHLGCVSCDKPPTWHGQWHASHFRSVGSAPHLRFDLRNIHKACSVCNNHLSGNIGAYLPELIRRIGMEAVEALQVDQEPRRYTIEGLKAITAEYRAKVRELKKRIEQ